MSEMAKTQPFGTEIFRVASGPTEASHENRNRVGAVTASTGRGSPQSKALCIHAGCRCEVEPGQNYCGDYCRQERQTGMEPQSISCRCGHQTCSGRVDPAFHT